MSNLLLLIDPQTDFHDLPNTQAYTPRLPVAGSWDDALRLAAFINAPETIIDEVLVTLDTHSELDISHPTYWIDNSTNDHPAPFTQITLNDLVSGRFKTSDSDKMEHACRYLAYLEDNNKLTHTIFNEHCIEGTEGYDIVAPVKQALDVWQKKTGKAPTLFNKGLNPDYEFFGPFEAQMIDERSPETAMRTQMILNMLNDHDTIYVTGQALSHCVGTGMMQIISVIETELPKDKQSAALAKLRFIKNTSSSVTGFEQVGKDVLVKLAEKGVSLIDV